ncbi:UvrD-helicase domain-containing protein [Gammaproteobacteria bacterium]|nr:UvrD-helicase domain-containing protein [Gammaproteobacteria bacterium]
MFELLIGITGIIFIYFLLSFNRPLANPADVKSRFKSLEEYRKEINNYRNRKLQSLLKNNAQFFDNLFAYPLTEEQRIAAVNDSNSSLVLASAGSGKTSTLLGKYLYLINKRGIEPNDILILSFDNAVQKDILQKIKPYGLKPETSTFHALGNKIIQSNLGYKKSFGILAREDREHLLVTENIQICIDHAKQKNLNLESRLIEFKALCPFHRIETFATSIEEYNSAISTYPHVREKHRTGDADRSLTIPALQPGVFVRSQEELTIANFLYLNSVNFEYEKSFQVLPNNDIDERPYHPDFYYPEIDLWHEHFALDANGHAPKAFEGYEDEVRIKKKIHSESKSNFIYTLSAEFETGDVLDKLKDSLTSKGVVFKPRDMEETKNRLQSIYFDDTFKLIRDVIKLQKGTNLSLDQAIKKIETIADKFRANKFKLIYKPIYRSYQDILHTNDELDFEDMINTATDILKQGGQKTHHSSSYNNIKWVLVDEFQDISLCRARFLTALRDNGYFGGSKLFCVGDDWQSIYAFAGSDLSQLHNFKDNFYLANTTFQTDKEGDKEKIWFKEQYADPHELRLSYHSMIYNALESNKVNINKIPDSEFSRFFITTNHRNDVSISLIGAEFIQANPNQIKKDISAVNSFYQNIPNKAFNVCKCDEYGELEIQKILLKIPENSSVRILARENAQLNNIDVAKILRRFPSFDIEKSSIHASKGLESDYVIIVGLEGGLNGFPKKKEDDPLKKVFKSISDQFPDAEERRVFYVAISRAKYGVYLCHKSTSQSQFINEISKIGSRLHIPLNEYNFSFASMECPNCRVKGRAGTLSPQVNFRKLKENPSARPLIFLTCNFSRKKKDALHCDYEPDFKSQVKCFVCDEDDNVGNLYIKDVMGNLFVCCTNSSCKVKIDFFDFRNSAQILQKRLRN